VPTGLYLQHKKVYLKKLLFFLLVPTVILTVTSCTKNGVFEKSQTLPAHAWAATNHLSFNFLIKDTAAYYNVYVVLAHTDAYHYNNIYLNITTIAAGDTAIGRQKSFQLANNSYGWLGTSIDDIIEHRILLNDKGPLRLKKGSYTVMLAQAMREDPLAEIISAGVRVEKVIQ